MPSITTVIAIIDKRPPKYLTYRIFAQSFVSIIFPSNLCITIILYCTNQSRLYVPLKTPKIIPWHYVCIHHIPSPLPLPLKCVKPFCFAFSCLMFFVTRAYAFAYPGRREIFNERNG
ncbi:hypothetical protein BZA77DRAFT_303949 [Pyronema omphalodes]|nr:hypothetical protein BZA77DRAFT_303949 [Pyronema omphalodes]